MHSNYLNINECQKEGNEGIRASNIFMYCNFYLNKFLNKNIRRDILVNKHELNP